MSVRMFADCMRQARTKAELAGTVCCYDQTRARNDCSFRKKEPARLCNAFACGKVLRAELVGQVADCVLMTIGRKAESGVPAAVGAWLMHTVCGQLLESALQVSRGGEGRNHSQGRFFESACEIRFDIIIAELRRQIVKGRPAKSIVETTTPVANPVKPLASRFCESRSTLMIKHLRSHMLLRG
jgi:hypothetical protein